MIITIGKANDNVYVADDSQVSRHHARLVSEPDGSWLLEDLDSTNGTFVNEAQIARKRISKSDQIRLGENFTLTLSDLLKAGNDYSEEFAKLKTVYDHYIQEKVRIQSSNQFKTRLMQSLPFALPGVIGVVVGFLGKGSGANIRVTAEQIEAGACGLKVHEDWGATRSAIDYSLKTADKYDVQVAVHTDTLNEGGFVEHTIEAIAGRTIHTYHTEGAGGGHAPDLLKVASKLNVIPASTNPTKPFTVNTIAEHLDMLMVCHHLDPKVPEDIAFADSRIRHQTIAAEDILQDMGVFSIMSSDSMAMGRIGEVITRTWQTASKMKKQRGILEGDSEENDNNRVRRYIAKYTINPALAQGISKYVGSIEVGKMADLVLWDTQFFGVKPHLVIKGGMVNKSIIGEANASIPTCQPEFYRDCFAAYGKAKYPTSATFVSKYAYEHGIKEELGLQKLVLPVSGIRNLTKKDMKLNNATPKLGVDPETYDVTVDGELITCEPAKELPLAQRYFLF